MVYSQVVIYLGGVNMVRLRNTLISFLIMTPMLIVSGELPSFAQEAFVVTVGQNKIFTEFNYHEAWFENDPNNSEPWPDQRTAVSDGNTANAALIAAPNHAGVAQARTGVYFQWDLGQYNWEDVKNWPVRITYKFSYEIAAQWTDWTGSGNAFVGCAGQGSWFDGIGFEEGTTGSRTDIVTVTLTNIPGNSRLITIGDIENAGRVLTVNAYSQAHSVALMQADNSSSSKITLTSIGIDFGEQGMIVNIGSGRCLRGQSLYGVAIVDCDNSETQIFTKLTDNTIRLGSDVCLDWLYGQVIVRACDGRSSQQWTMTDDGLLVSSNNKCAKVLMNSQMSGAEIRLAPCNLTAQSRLFKLIPAGTVVEQCFGAVGSKCEGIPFITPSGSRRPDGTQTVFVSVGSIAHDNCCLQNSDGVMCAQGNTDNNWWIPCKAEWEKAVRNTINNRQWTVNLGVDPFTPPYSLTHYTDDLTPAALPNRRLGLPSVDTVRFSTPNRLSSRYDIPSSVRETVSTRRFSAPAGTTLDWYDIDFCESRRADYRPKEGVIICR
jgi:hypothetical protein